MTTDTFTRAQQDICDRMLADPFFQYMTIIREDAGVSESDVEMALQARYLNAGKQGIAIIVMKPSRKVINPDVPGPQHSLSFLIRIMELPKLNLAPGGTQVRAMAISERVEQIFHLFDNGDMLFSGSHVDPYNDGEGTVGDDVYLTPQLQGNYVPIKTCLPQGAVAGALPDAIVTLTCATVGASIYYTTDGTYPRLSTEQAPTTAQLYNAPLTLDVATKLRIAAYAASEVPSDVLFLPVS